MADHDHQAAERGAAVAWICAAVLYVGSEAVAASAFSPNYSYADNYISDLGVSVCGTIFDGRAICSPLHALMNADFAFQGVAFLGAAIAIARAVPTRTRYAFVAFAALNGVGNLLIGSFPENAPGRLGGTFNFHVLGALLAILFGNATALMSVWTFAGLRLARVHRAACIALPTIAALSFTMLLVSRGSGRTTLFPDGIWERISVYAIPAWELLSAFCLIGRARSR